MSIKKIFAAALLLGFNVSKVEAQQIISAPYSFGISRLHSPQGEEIVSTINFNKNHDFYLGSRKAVVVGIDGTGPGCYELITRGGMPGFDNADTRFYVEMQDSKGVWGWVSLDDDSGPDYFSKARIFTAVSGGLKFAITGYSNTINTQAFGFNVKYIGNNFDACNNGTPLARYQDAPNFTPILYGAN